MDNKCEYCEVEQNRYQGKVFGENDSLQIVKYGNEYMLRHGVGWYDEYDSYDIENKIEYWPKCGRKFNVEV